MDESQIDRFVEVTQWTGSREEAKAFINSANGDLDAAVMAVLEGGVPINDLGQPAESHPASPPHRRQAAVPNRSLMEELSEEYTKDLVKSKAPRVRGSKYIYYVRIPLISVIFDIIDWLVDAILPSLPPMPKIIRLNPSLELPPKEVHAAFFDRLVLPMLRKTDSVPRNVLRGTTYIEALEKTKSNYKYLLVVLLSELQGPSSVAIIKQLLSTQTISRDNVYVWFCSAVSIEGFNLMTEYNAHTLPFIALISPSPKNAQSGVVVMANLLEISGANLASSDSIANFDSSVHRVMEEHEPKLLSLRLDRERFDVDRKIREEQDEAYRKSLEKDQQREREQKAEAERKRLETFKYEAWISKVFERAAALENAAQPSSPYARVALRLPDGTRFNLSVPGDFPASDIYDFAYARMNPSVPVPPKCEIDSSLLSDYEPPYGFSLVSTVTRKLLPSDSTAIHDIDAAWPSGVFMVDPM